MQIAELTLYNKAGAKMAVHAATCCMKGFGDGAPGFGQSAGNSTNSADASLLAAMYASVDGAESPLVPAVYDNISSIGTDRSEGAPSACDNQLHTKVSASTLLLTTTLHNNMTR
jgi:hypothetical protein